MSYNSPRRLQECYDRCLVLLKRGESSFHALELPVCSVMHHAIAKRCARVM
jgi:hypothetical protein